MDVLVEMTPGTGWLARENDRIVFLPGAESIDVAHDVIEPLLIPKDVEESFVTLGSWIQSSRPLPAMLLLSLENSVRLMCHEVDAVDVTEAASGQTHRLDLGTTADPVSAGLITQVAIADVDDEASGMLVEGVIRAGGLRVHIHRGWGADANRDTDIDLPNSELHLELEGKSIVIGNGLVIGRWPYSHPEFDTAHEPLILSDPAVSRLHAVVVPTADGIAITDRGSHNGSWVLRETGSPLRLTPGTAEPLATGDRIRVGDTVLNVI